MKRLFFITLLFILIKSPFAFCSLSVEDYKQMEIEGVEPTYNQITQDQTSYENWVSYVDSKTDSHYNLPSFSDVATLTENLLAYSVGNYADVASGVFDNLADTFSLGSDIWDFMTFNVQQMTFDYLPDFVQMLKSGVDDEIYITPSQTVGNWVSVPCNTSRLTVNGTSYWEEFVSDGVAYATIVKLGTTYQILLASFINGTRVQRYENYLPSGRYLMATYTLSSKYEGTESVGFYGGYATGEPFTMVGSSGYYSSQETALAELFGWNGSSEPYLDGGIIVNDNPIINPVSLTSALGYPYKETIINNYNNGTPIPWQPNNYNYVDYNYSYDIPFWGGQELETLDYPEEIEFPTIEFETISIDENLDLAIESLDGSWLVKFFLVAIFLLILGLIL